MPRARGLAQSDQPFGPAVDQLIIHGSRDAGGDSQQTAYGLDEAQVYATQVFLAAAEIELLENFPVVAEVTRLGVVVLDGLPVDPRPIGIAHPRVANPLVILALGVDRDGDPLEPVRRLYAVTVAPVAAGEEHFFLEDELVHPPHHGRIPLSHNVSLPVD